MIINNRVFYTARLPRRVVLSLGAVGAVSTLVPWPRLSTLRAPVHAAHAVHIVHDMRAHGAPRLIAEASILTHNQIDEHIFLPVTVDGQRVTAVLDLGTSGNGLASRYITHPNIFGAGEIDTLHLGTATIRHIPVESPLEAEEGQMFSVTGLPPGWPPVAALLGVEVQAHFDIVLDGPARRVRLYARDPSAMVGHAPPWLPPGVTAADCLPMHRRAGQYHDMVDMPVTVNGHRTYGHFDSGAKQNYMHMIEAHQLGLTDSAVHLSGVVDQQRYFWRGLTLQIGRQTIPNQQAVVHVAAPPQADSLQFNFGLEAFRDRILFISYSTDQLCLSAGPVRHAP